MSKNTEITFVGQPVFKQIVNLLQVIDLPSIINKHKADRYYKTYTARTHLITMLFGILSRCDSMGEICDGMRAMSGKLNHLGLNQSPAKSTACDGLRNRSDKFFEEVYFSLVKAYSSFLSDSRTFGLTFKEVLLIDSTTIRLFSDLLKGVGRNVKGDGRKKGGLKVHMLIDAVQQVGRFIKISEAKMHDKNFLSELRLERNCMIVFDKAYNHYQQFAQWTKNGVYFVTRQKSNAVFEEVRINRYHYEKKGIAKVLLDEIIVIEYPAADTDNKKLILKEKVRLRRVCYKDEKDRKYVFLTNNMDIPAEEVAFLYKKRWNIEILFKKMKQNFQLQYFYGENETAIRTQIWCTLIAQLLMTVLQKKAQTKKAFSLVATLIRIHLISLLDVYGLLKSTNRFVVKNKDAPSGNGQLIFQLT